MPEGRRSGFVAWCESELLDVYKRLARYESGAMHVGRRVPGGEWEDITPQETARLRRMVIELEALLAEHADI